MPRKSPDLEAVATALARLLRRGLPVSPSAASPVLLGLRGVLARAVDPADESSRLAALDGLLRGSLARFPDVRYAEAVRALFGLPPAEPGRNLTARREVAANVAGQDVHHFRKRVEPRLIERLATAVLADSDRFTRSRLIAPRLVPAGERQPVPADPFAWEVVEHEEALCRVWAAIYALRAELLAVERLLSLGVDRQQVIGQAVTAAWRWGLASAQATGYAAAFGTTSGADSPADGVFVTELLAGAGWTPPLTSEQRALLTDAAAGGGDRETFVAALHAETSLCRAWVDALLTTATGTAGVEVSHQERQDS